MNSLSNILVAVDLTEGSANALKHAAHIAAQNEAAIHIVHVIDNLVMSDLEYYWPEDSTFSRETIYNDEVNRLKEWAEEQLPDRDDLNLSVKVGSPLNEVIHSINEFKADLLVIGIRGASNGSGAGSLATKLIQKAPTKVLLVKRDHQGPFKRIVVAVDFSETADIAARQAVRVAAQNQAEVYFVHVLQAPWEIQHYRAPTLEANPAFQKQYLRSLNSRLEEVMRQACGDLTVNGKCILIEGRSYAHSIIEFAKQQESDLVVLGTKGRTNLRYVFLGSTAEKVLREVDQSVLAIKPAEYSIQID